MFLILCYDNGMSNVVLYNNLKLIIKDGSGGFVS